MSSKVAQIGNNNQPDSCGIHMYKKAFDGKKTVEILRGYKTSFFNKVNNKDVAFYAQKLNLTPNHLNETIKSITGKSAKKRIEDALILESEIF